MGKIDSLKTVSKKTVALSLAGLAGAAALIGAVGDDLVGDPVDAIQSVETPFEAQFMTSDAGAEPVAQEANDSEDQLTQKIDTLSEADSEDSRYELMGC